MSVLTIVGAKPQLVKTAVVARTTGHIACQVQQVDAGRRFFATGLYGDGTVAIRIARALPRAA